MKDRRTRRSEARRYKRLVVRFGNAGPAFRSLAIQLSPRGLFLSTNNPVYTPGSRLSIAFDLPGGPCVVEAVVRHAKKVPQELARIDRPGMGVEFIDPPPELVEFIRQMK